MAAANLENLVVRLEAVTGRLEAAASRGGFAAPASGGNDDPIWVDDFNTFNDSIMSKFIADSTALGAELAKQAAMLKTAFDHHKNLLLVAARNGRPAGAVLQQLLKPLSESITQIQDFREKNRPSKQFFHLSAVSEAVPFLGWVAVSPKPSAYVQQMEESAVFYTNKILKEFRESDPKQADWARSLIQLLKTFGTYVKDNHGTGLLWNRDKPAATATSSAGPSAPPPPPPPSAAGVAPPPPPPIQAPTPSAAPAAQEPDKSQLFAQLNKGADVTKGLKKVTNDMKTHKNPVLRNQAPVPVTKSSALSPRPYTPPTFKKFNAPAAVVKKPPVFELQMKKWVVEYQEGNQNLVIEDTSDKQTVYMYQCKNSVLQVKGKVNSITLDGCVRCGVVFENLISTCEMINCKSIKVQANGKVPTISIDKTDGAQIYLNEGNIGTQIISAKSSEMNVSVSKANGDMTECPLPEQYKTIYENGKFVTTTMDLNL